MLHSKPGKTNGAGVVITKAQKEAAKKAAKSQIKKRKD